MFEFLKNKRKRSGKYKKDKKDKKIVVHQVNCAGKMNTGLSKQIKDKYPQLFKDYRERCMMFDFTELLGSNYYYEDKDIIIVNMFSQIGYDTDTRQTDYEALATCLDKVRKMYPTQTIIAPYLIGCDPGGGNWNVVSKILEKYNIEIKENIKL